MHTLISAGVGMNNQEINMRSSVLINDDLRAQRDENRWVLTTFHFSNFLKFSVFVDSNSTFYPWKFYIRDFCRTRDITEKLQHGPSRRLSRANVRGAGSVPTGALVGNATSRIDNCRAWWYVHAIGYYGPRFVTFYTGQVRTGYIDMICRAENSL